MRTVSAKVTSKGQITLPAALRSELGLKAGDHVDFHRRNDGKLEMTARTGTFEDLRGILKTDIVLSDEELAAAIAETWTRRPGPADGDDHE